ncbi:MAG TPA: VWA domain-containing protein [Candidatus Saccharimonadales bacterium]|jgi:VWFA-related protein|nr:VWA domain-containing protein [Candidatus Saccharimonadales bacterium]
MRPKWPVAILSLFLLQAALIAVKAQSQSAPVAPTSQQSETKQSSLGQSGYVLKVTTRLVTLDVIATDSHGNPVRDLKPEDLQIFEEHKAQQRIEHFEYFETLKRPGIQENPADAIRKASGIISNQLPLDLLKIPPTVLLMDSLNTQTPNQAQGRAKMIQLLRGLPPDTPVAVFLLGSSLRILQGFTSDGKLLRAALDQSLVGNSIQQDPRNDLGGTSSYILNETAGSGINLGLESQIGEVQNFEKEEYSMSVDLRMKETLGAFTQIGQYLSGIPGRKNLIWVSESFPLTIVPDPSTGNNPFGGSREYSEEIKNVGNKLTDAQVAVYPMDVRGLQAQQSLSASQNINLPETRVTGPTVANRLNVEDADFQQTLGTMDEIAQDTGGKSCKNGNDLSACVMTALKDSSSYYEMSFYPAKANWDGRFHKIIVKTSRPGVKLVYRRGYYALDAASLAKQQQPSDHLRQACADQLPSTAIPLTVRPMMPSEYGNAQGGLHYMLVISTAGLSASQTGDSYSMNLRVADCEFAQKATVFRFNEREMSKTITSELFRSWQSTGIPDHIALMPSADTQRIRLVVLDVASGLTGAIDIPVLPSEIAKATAPIVPPAPVATTPYVEFPDKVKGPPQPKIVESLTFHLDTSVSGTLNWKGDSLLYQTAGDMPLDKAAGGFASYAFGGRFHCQDGHFVPLDAADGEPVLRLTFHNHSGKVLVVDLKGEQAVFIGDLPVDPSAQTFFEQVWKVSHCRE